MIKPSFTPIEKAEIETAYKDSLGTPVERHLKALWMWASGKTVQEISKETGFSQNYIPVLMRKCRKIGISAYIETERKAAQADWKKVHIFSEEEISAIEAACKQVTDSWTLRRLEVLRLRALGTPKKEIVRKTGYSAAQVVHLFQDYREYGLEAFVAMPRTGKRKYTAYNFDLTAKQVVELKHGYETAQTKNVARRFKALLLRSEGNTYKRIASETGLSKQYVSMLTQKYKKTGISALLSKPHLSNSSYILTTQQKAEIRAAQGADMSEHAVKRLEVLRLRAEEKSYKEIVDITGYRPTYIPMILRKYREYGLEAVLEDKKPPKSTHS